MRTVCRGGRGGMCGGEEVKGYCALLETEEANEVCGDVGEWRGASVAGGIEMAFYGDEGGLVGE